MKVLRHLFLVAAVCGLTLSAFADSADFQANVLDPPFGGTTIDSNTFPVVFSPCVKGTLPAGVHANGCFLGVNDSGNTWTSLDIFFPGTLLGGQPVSCSPVASGNIFSEASCGTDSSGNYLLTFTDGSIPSGDGFASYFFITEAGECNLSDFDGGYAVANAPEPASAVLMLTGIFVLGFFSIPGFRKILIRA